MILADTSAWIEYDRATGSPADRRLSELISTDGPLATTEPVLMEVLAGARSAARADDLRRMLFRFETVPFEAQTDFEAAASIYRRCRRAGVTPRGIIDCMIAAVAWRSGASLLSHDRDLSNVAAIIDVPMDQGSLRP